MSEQLFRDAYTLGLDIGKPLFEAGLLPANCTSLTIEAKPGRITTIHYECFATPETIDSVIGTITDKVKRVNAGVSELPQQECSQNDTNRS